MAGDQGYRKNYRYDSSNSTFNLPKDKARYLSRGDNLYNFSASMQWIPVLAQVEDKIV